MVRPIQRRKLPWGLLTVLLVLMLILAYLLSGLMKLDGVTFLNWQNRFAEVLLHRSGTGGMKKRCFFGDCLFCVVWNCYLSDG